MRERRWSTRQVGEAIKRSPMYVSRRLRVFEDDVLGGPVLAGQIAVSTADGEPLPRLASRIRALREELAAWTRLLCLPVPSASSCTSSNSDGS